MFGILSKKKRKLNSSPYINKNKNFSIILSIVVTVSMLSIIVLVSTIYMWKLRGILKDELNSQLLETNSQSISSIKKQVNRELELLKSISLSLGRENNINLETTLPILVNESNYNKFKRMGIILPSGKSYTSDGYTQDFSTRSSFKNAINGTATVSDVLIDKIDGENIIVYNVPIYHNKDIIGVIFGTHSLNVYKDILSVSSFNGNGESYILENNGKMIINSDKAKINTFPDGTLNKNIYATSKNNEDFNTMKLNMINGKSGTLEYNIAESDVYMTYSPIGINNWYLISSVQKELLTEKFNSLMTITFNISIFIILIFAAIMLFIIYSQYKSKKALSNLAYVDNLTGASNYTRFSIDVEYLLKNTKDNYVFVLFDIDKFKYINDSFGFNEGNRILKNISYILDESIYKGETFSRVRCDHYSILMKYKNDEDIIFRLNELNKKFTKINSSLSSKYNLIINYGVYKIQNEHTSINTISDMAEIALETVKGSHKSSIAFYNDELKNKVLEECEIENHMYLALENREFKVFLQPKYNLEPTVAVGAEALIRWMHPKKGLLSPGIFIPIFERNGFIANIDMYVFEEVCKLIRNWIDSGITPIPISVNQSRASLYSSTSIENLKELIMKYNIPPSLIEIEITESAVFDNVSQLIEIMIKLKEIGFILSMDDFGSGYSSLNLLKDIPVDVLKLDREFFNETATTKRGKTVISSIVSMAKSLEIKVISEGVETIEQSNFLKTIKCDMVQGYLYGKPMIIEEFEENVLEI